MQHTKRYLASGDAARALGFSTTALYAHDNELMPERLSNGARIYDAARVAELAEKRRAARAAKAIP